AEVPLLATERVRRLQDAERHGEDHVDLARTRPELVRVRDDADERRDHELRRHRLDVVERAEELDVGGREADLLLGFAQRGREEVGILAGMMPSARKRDLPLMVREMVRAAREEQARLAVEREERDEDGGRRL